MTDNFLPEGYEVPSKDNGYMKLEQGENRFRILSKALLGVEIWTAERKPVRFRPEEKFEMKPEYTGSPKHFWAFVVWNYQKNQIQILEITQKTIMNAISNLSRNSKWGSPFDYDITIVRTGDGMETEYSITPDPKEPLDPAIKKEFESLKINLEALYESGDPFAEIK